MKIRILQEFVTLAKHRNYTVAAKELYITQPCLSNHMIAMEKELGFSVFEKTTKTFSLTPAGKELLRQSQVILDTWDKMLKKCSELSGAFMPVRIVGTPKGSPRLTILERAGIPFALVEMDNHKSFVDSLAEGVADIAFYSDCRGMEGWEEKLRKKGLLFAICHDTSSWAVSFMKAHPLASRDSISAKDIARYPIRINSGALFDTVCFIIKTMFPPDTELFFVMDPVDDPRCLVETDFEDHVHICGLSATQELVGLRNDMMLLTSVEDLSLEVRNGMLYPIKPRTKELKEHIKQILACLAPESDEASKGW